jgi:hypothetical protein
VGPHGPSAPPPSETLHHSSAWLTPTDPNCTLCIGCSLSGQHHQTDGDLKDFRKKSRNFPADFSGLDTQDTIELLHQLFDFHAKRIPELFPGQTAMAFLDLQQEAYFLLLKPEHRLSLQKDSQILKQN